MTLPPRMKFGIFLGPFHRVGENPTLALDRDIELLQWLDHLGFDEAWIGEHHSAGWETIASPEVFIANVAERTRHIKLGTGVMSLPYHQPLMATNRMVLLDHLTRGRAMMGVGPGILLSDARMLGIDPTVQRRRLDEALGAIMQLLKGPEPVNVETDWFTLVDAVPHLAPYTKPHFPVAVASSLSPTGATLAGKYGVNLLSNVTVGTTFPDLARHWQVAEETASSHGNRMDREEWRLLQIVHLAETHKEAMDQARTGPGERISSANIWSGRSAVTPFSTDRRTRSSTTWSRKGCGASALPTTWSRKSVGWMRRAAASSSWRATSCPSSRAPSATLRPHSQWPKPTSKSSSTSGPALSRRPAARSREAANQSLHPLEPVLARIHRRRASG